MKDFGQMTSDEIRAFADAGNTMYSYRYSAIPPMGANNRRRIWFDGDSTTKENRAEKVKRNLSELRRLGWSGISEPECFERVYRIL